MNQGERPFARRAKGRPLQQVEGVNLHNKSDLLLHSKIAA